MGDRGDQGRLSVLGRPFFFERDGFDGRRTKIVGRLLLDGGTVEEPSQQTLVLDVPHKPRRRFWK